jgi:ABC-type transport system involved in cytochrome bd biosynthesis fused ATPase/permease subunit
MLKNPAILLLDEATSALDSESEKSVQEALDKVMLGRTTVVVAHRLSTVQAADMIAFVHAGRVLEAGPHADLLRAGGPYAALVKMQRDAPPSPLDSASSNAASILRRDSRLVSSKPYFLNPKTPFLFHAET